MITTKQSTKKHGNFTAVGQFSLHMALGEIYGLLEANGAGKSATINPLSGSLKSTPGANDRESGDYSSISEMENRKQLHPGRGFILTH